MTERTVTHGRIAPAGRVVQECSGAVGCVLFTGRRVSQGLETNGRVEIASNL